MGANVDGYVTIGTQLDLSGIKGDLSELQSLVKNSTSKMVDTVENSTTKLTNVISSKFNSIKRIIIGIGLYSLIRKMFDMGDAVSRVDTLNNYVNVMSNLGISADKAQKSVNLLSEKLQGLPTTLDDAALSVQRLTAANGDIGASTEMFLAMNNAILAGGASTEIQKSAIEQLSQAYSKGKPDMMEWRTMLMTMPAQLKQVAIAMGYVNADQLGEALRSGKISMDDFMATVVRLNKQGLDGFQSFEQQAMNSTGGIRTSIINLKTAITRGLADIMNAIGQSNIAAFFNNITAAIKKCIPYVSAFVRALLMIFGVKVGDKNTKASKNIDDIGKSGVSAAKGVDKTTGSVKKLNKELKGIASFDEMNVLPDKTSSSGAGGDSGAAGGVGLGAIDTTEFDKSLDSVSAKVKDLTSKIYNFLNPIFTFIKDHWQELIGFILGSKISKKILDLLTKLKKAKQLTKFLTNLNNIIKSLGWGVALAGLIMTIKAVIEFIKDPSFKNFIKILEGIAVAVIGVAIAFGAWPVAVVAALALVIIEIIKHWDKVKEILKPIVTWLWDNILKPIWDLFKLVFDLITLPFKTAIDFVKDLFKGLFDGIKKIIDGICDIFKGNFKEGIKKILGGFGDILLAPFKALYDGAKKFISELKKLIGELIDKAKELGEKLINAGAKLGSGLFGKSKNGKKAGNELGAIIYDDFFQIPQLARGGIINQPGRGVPLSSAIGGERGMEGVIPLTDSQQMALLGEAIGKYITINASITNEMNGRVISRELQKINNESNFAFNR